MQIPRLHPDTTEQVKQRVDIFDVVSERVVLRKRGKDYVGLCPFHEEKTPSFTVSPSKQMYYCFGCGVGGNAIKFLMEVGKQSFSEVVLDLAQRYQVPVQTLEPEQRQELQRQLSVREQLYEILALTAAFYQHALRQPQGQHALEYLQLSRRLSEETIQQFQLGYVPAGWETIYRYLVEHKGKPVQLVEQAGLILPRKSGDGYYDRFRDRIIIPIHDAQGRVIGFGGRALGDEQPKYLNSPETQLFDKGKTLFALDKARNAIGKHDQAVVVEGYFDAIALHAVGIANVVASLGTALSLDQVRQLLRYTESKQIILNFDADRAGNIAAERAIGEIANLAYTGQVQLRILNLPDGKDADEFLKGHPNAAQRYQQLLIDAPLWLDWQINQILLDKDITQAKTERSRDANQFQQAAREMVKLLNQVEDINQRTYYINHCAQLLSQGQNRLIPLYAKNLQVQLKKLRIPPIKNASLPTQKQNKKNQDSALLLPISSEQNLLEQAEALLLRIYLHRPEYRQTIIDTLDSKDLLFSLSNHRFLWQQILELQAIADQMLGDTSNPLISLLQDRSIEFPDQLAQVEHLFHLDEKCLEEITRTPLVIRTAAVCLEMVACERHRSYCLEQWQKLDISKERALKQYYGQEFQSADQQLQELEQMRQVHFSEILQL
ncbi:MULTISPECIES: DNA primase [unclassified Coleofasciculus]|uniref:DNA primase n=1 Tax=unclassified Coleofasciculus TaxID=2692782 RepID=UPI00187F917F|nr:MULTISPECIES: DNA primase [unclassified Coleofasciculus]MBE9125588.1 DNA primase [Coleofasciculus sp. LEGE 07081]MBE9147302.1 DNA primase [Coleofasciculus sp. LEGE 07092]